ncbi:MAG: glycosyltransferase family 2 protein [Pirellulaceae bacterium]|nr:glycosyltransferase family 2 protein [Pirellulaceae bacterium]
MHSIMPATATISPDATLCSLENSVERLSGDAAASSLLIDSVTVVVPCHNESAGVDRLKSRLLELESEGSKRCDPCAWRFVFVDDGSRDATYDDLCAAFGQWPHAKIVRHETSRGLIAAIQTGFKHCDSKWIAVIDSACTYHPLLLIDLLEKADREGYEVVTASPSLSEGHRQNFVDWRTTLSRVTSWVYRRSMRNKLSSYTSCVAVYSTSWVRQLALSMPGFVGLTELLWHLDNAGARIGEYPAVQYLPVAVGRKMGTMWASLQHFRLLARVIRHRLKNTL